MASPHRKDFQADTAWPPPAPPAAQQQHSTVTVTSGGGAPPDPPPPPPAPPAPNGHSVIAMVSVMPAADVDKLHVGQPQAAVADLVERWTRQHRRKQQQQNRAKSAAAAAVAAATSGGAQAPATGAAAAAAAAAGGAKPPPGYLQGPGTLMDLGSQLSAVTDTTTPLLSGLPMRGVLRCVHIHEVRRFCSAVAPARAESPGMAVRRVA